MIGFRAGLTDRENDGFTIVELMIALSVLSTILVISSAVVINLGVLFTRGVNQSNTQNTARNVINEIANQLKLGGATPILPAGSPVFCLGSQRYAYVLDHKLDGASTSDHVLWRDTMNNSASCQSLAITGVPNPTDSLTNTTISGAELMGANMRLTDFNIYDNGNGTYTVKVTVAYGDDDLVYKISGRTLCRAGSGSQFCAVSSLVQTVSKRESM